MPNVRTGRKGDLYVKIVVQTPTHLSSAQKKLLEEYAALDKATNTPGCIPLASLQ